MRFLNYFYRVDGSSFNKLLVIGSTAMLEDRWLYGVKIVGKSDTS
jgi:hypothetical protein